MFSIPHQCPPASIPLAPTTVAFDGRYAGGGGAAVVVVGRRGGADTGRVDPGWYTFVPVPACGVAALRIAPYIAFTLWCALTPPYSASRAVLASSSDVTFLRALFSVVATVPARLLALGFSL